ncbi:nitroreductase family protein [Candidatus Woesearchaeota archaeon]|nr:nitroreductase family protein [Candidatus Woesearchaeota archaeon]
MDVEQAVIERRSVRNYLPDKPVPKEIVGKILDIARYAPSSGNLQNWKVILVSDHAMKEELANAALKQKWITMAPLLLVVCNSVGDVKRLYKERGEFLYSIQNVSAFVQNILLTAHSIGLGTCWIGAFDPEAVKRVLRIPDDVEPEAIISIGYAAEEFDAPSRKTIEQFCFFDIWGSSEKGFGPLPLQEHMGAVGEVSKKGKSFFSRIFKK